MKKVTLKSLGITESQITEDYKELNSSYRVAEKYKTSATAVKRILKEIGILRNQSDAAIIRGNPVGFGDYKRNEKHLNRLSNFAKNRVAQKNSNFKHGKYSEVSGFVRDKTQTSVYKKLKLEVLKRDKFTCLFCKTNANLAAHHIIPFWLCREAELDVENMVTVCKLCHFKEAHLCDWHNVNLTLASDTLLKKYSLNRERLSEIISHFRKNFKFSKIEKVQ